MEDITTEKKIGFPRQIGYIVGNELCERYSYGAMKSILVIYMITFLSFAKHDATSIFHIFVSTCYFLPVFGAYISDRFLGKYKTIILLSLVYCFGHIALSVWENTFGLYLGLGLIAIGNGGILATVSANVGDQFTKENEHLLPKVYSLFYWAINFGSFFATLATPLILQKWGPTPAFGIPAILMFAATFIFWLGRKKYVHVPPKGKNPHGVLSVLKSAFKRRNEKQEGESFLDVAIKDHPLEDVDAVKAIFNLSKIFLTVAVFYSLFDQHSSTWIIQAKQMNMEFMGFTLTPSQIPALNPIMVMALIPIFTFGIYPAIEKVGIKVTPLRKMGAGMFVTAFSFIIIAVYQYVLDAGKEMNVMWQFFPYLVITMAEVLVAITGLEFAYTQAPKHIKSTIMSVWLLTLFLGNLLTAVIAQINIFNGGNFFLFFTILMVVVSFLFIKIAKEYKMKDYVQ